MRLNFRIIYADGSAAVATASVADQVAFEREFDKSIVELAQAPKVGDMCWLAWHGLRRKNAGTAEFDEWINTVDAVEMVDSELVPLESTAPTGA